jgi:endoglucanase
MIQNKYLFTLTPGKGGGKIISGEIMRTVPSYLFPYFFKMKKMKKNILSLLMLFTLSISPAVAQSIVDEHGLLTTKGNKIVDSTGQPFSISGNSLFWTNWAGEFCNADVVNWLKQDWKSGLVRIPVGIEPNGGYLTNPVTEKQKVFTVVDACIAAGIYVLIDWHEENAFKHTAQSIAFFQEMATKYGTYPNVMYEIYNEPLAVSWSTVIKPYALQVIDSIRAIDPDNLIIVGTPNWSQDVDVAANDPITGYDNIAYTLHFYVPMHSQWLRDKATVAINKGLPIFVTEWGFWSTPPDMDEFYLWENFMKKNQISNANWSVYTKVEASSVLKTGASPKGGWTESQLTDPGKIVRDMVIHWYDSIVPVQPKICDTISILSKIKAADWCSKSGVMVEYCLDVDSGLSVGYMDPGDYMKYICNVDSAATYTVNFRVASLNGGGQFQIKSGTTILGSVDVGKTNGWQTWTTIAKNITLTAGIQEISIYTTVGGFNLNWFQFGAKTENGIASIDQPDLMISPNPFTNTIQLSGLNSNEKNSILICDALGKIIYSAPISNTILEVENNWPSGIYFLKLSNEKSAHTYKIIKE